MTIFASTPTRNTDPWPRVWQGHSIHNRMRTDTDMFREHAPANNESYLYLPRPKFDQPRAHAANPVLVEFRANIDRAKRLIARGVDIDMLTLLGLWRLNLTAMETFGGHVAWNDTTHPMHFLTKATEAQVEHASEVIYRLYDLQVMAHV